MQWASRVLPFLNILINIFLPCVTQAQVHAEIPPLPRLPELYLEAGAALLMARQPADCIALCDEVISSTLELLPDKVVLEEPEEKGQAGAEGEDRAGMLLWAGAAYLLQGHCHALLKGWQQAVTHYTRYWHYFCCYFLWIEKNNRWVCPLCYRCINLLVKVCFKKSGEHFSSFFEPYFLLPCTATVTLCLSDDFPMAGFPPQIPSADMVGQQGTHLCVLQRLKGLSLAGRGISFSQTDQLKGALRDLQLSLQALPGIYTTSW